MKNIKKTDSDFPEQLRKIPQAPSEIYLEGKAELLKQNSIAIVGSRNCTPYGKEVANRFARELAKAGFCIVSGLAIGIDTQAHLGALQEKGSTIAILGQGINQIYPQENEFLYHSILAEGGAIVSEYPQNETKKQFIKRNRIVAGLALATLVIEAEARSGTSTTVHYTKQQNKKVFCIPSNITSISGTGTNQLIKQGAILVTSPKEIIKEYKEKQKYNMSKAIQKTRPVPKAYEAIYKEIGQDPISIELLYKKMDININEINSILTMLELEGFIQQLPGKTFIRKEGGV